MAIERIGQVTNLNKSDFLGLSTDVKPTNIDSDSSFFELDTMKFWVFSKANINPATSNGWWLL
jgi:hypothetical protein